MRTFFTTALFVLCCLPVSSSAQSVWKHFGQPDLGSSFRSYTYEEKMRVTTAPGSEESYSNSFLHIGLHLGFNLPFFPVGENMAFGLNPAAELSIAGGSTDSYNSNGMLTIELPWYATFKLGSDALYRGAKFPLGLSLGIGCHYSYMTTLESEFSESIVTPSLMAEVCIGKRRSWGLFKIRYTHDIGSYTLDYSEPEFDVEHTLEISRSAVHVLYVFGY